MSTEDLRHPSVSEITGPEGRRCRPGVLRGGTYPWQALHKLVLAILRHPLRLDN